MGAIAGGRTDLILDAIKALFKQRGICPTIREIGRYTGIRSTSMIRYHLLKLERQGSIKIIPGASRSIIVKDQTQSNLATELEQFIHDLEAIEAITPRDVQQRLKAILKTNRGAA